MTSSERLIANWVNAHRSTGPDRQRARRAIAGNAAGIPNAAVKTAGQDWT
ncbi:hypothetical protein [Microvirga aerophila]|uniref:Uncharacterized protein n=1 Tax=Microvirga aerophila TaxID=670291 RepID=A0A512BV01_9HYPH|nr:hypothetical protein [Microvirga aerophila]GEO15782.1 hypothetical protein MAE02_34780 [Microvirga aerophila]